MEEASGTVFLSEGNEQEEEIRGMSKLSCYRKGERQVGQRGNQEVPLTRRYKRIAVRGVKLVTNCGLPSSCRKWKETLVQEHTLENLEVSY
jgi:hypothetical protein